MYVFFLVLIFFPRHLLLATVFTISPLEPGCCPTITKPHSPPGERKVESSYMVWEKDKIKGKDVRVEGSKMGILLRDGKDQGIHTVLSHQDTLG